MHPWGPRPPDRHHSPFCLPILLRVKIICDFPKLGEDLMDDVFELLQAVGPHLRDVVHHDHRVDPIGLLGPVLENVPQQLCMDRKLDK